MSELRLELTLFPPTDHLYSLTIAELMEIAAQEDSINF